MEALRAPAAQAQPGSILAKDTWGIRGKWGLRSGARGLGFRGQVSILAALEHKLPYRPALDDASL